MEPLNTRPEEDLKQESTDRFPCPSCGGNMVFDPATQSLKCPYCDRAIEIVNKQEEIKEYDIETAEQSASTNWGREKRIIKCESCGAQTVLDENSTAQFCAFCGSSHIVKQDESAGIVPESLIPFKITKDNALTQFKQWIKKRYFAPRALKNEYKNQKLNGVYIPCWTYDSNTYSNYTAEAGTYYYVTETDWVEENGQRKMVTRQVRKIAWHFVSGSYSEFFDDVLINASNQVDERLMQKLEPFHLEQLIPYKPEYLSGFLAERYGVSLQEGWDKARSIMDDKIRRGIERQIHADEVRNLNVNTFFSNVKFKHLLLPVWVSAYTYNGKVYRYMVNGETGEVQGKAPVSALKVCLLILGILAVAAAVWFLFLKDKTGM